MKKTAGLFCIGILVLLTALGCTPDYKSQYQKAVDSYFGTVEEGHYSNGWLKAEMDVPEKWAVAKDPMMDAVRSVGDAVKDQEALDKAKKDLDTLPIYNLLQVFKKPVENQKDFNPSLVMIAEKTKEKGVADAVTYLEASRQAMAQRQMPMGFEQKLDAPVESVDIGGMEFAHLQIVVETGMFQITQDCYARMQGDTVLGIMVSWKDEAEKAEMMNALSTLKIGE